MSVSENSTESTVSLPAFNHGGGKVLFNTMVHRGGKVLMPYDDYMGVETSSGDEQGEMPEVSGVFMLEEEIANLLATIDTAAQSLVKARLLLEDAMTLMS